MGRALIFIIVLIVFIPLMAFELPTLIQSIPRPILKVLCFVPAGTAAFLAIRSFLEGNIAADVISVLTCMLFIYGGFTLKSMID